MQTYADRVIDAFGGTSATAKLTGIPVTTVHAWRKNGIPRSRMAHLELVASMNKIEIPGDVDATQAAA